MQLFLPTGLCPCDIIKSPFCTKMSQEFFPGHSLLDPNFKSHRAYRSKALLRFQFSLGAGGGNEKISQVVLYTWHCSTSGGLRCPVVSFLMMWRLIAGFNGFSLHNQFLHQQLTSWFHHTLLTTAWRSYFIRQLQNSNFPNSNIPSSAEILLNRTITIR